MTVTERETPVSTGVSTSPDPVPTEPAEVSSLQSEAGTEGDAARRLWAAVVEYLTPPSLLVNPPDAVKELAAYAHHGAWTKSPDARTAEENHGTAQKAGKVRRLGILWWRLVGLPVTAVCRYVEWIAQRPGRAVPIFVLWQVVTASTPGHWATDYLLTPLAHAAAWIWL